MKKLLVGAMLVAALWGGHALAQSDPDEMTTGGVTVLDVPHRALDERETGQVDRVTLPMRPWWATAAMINVAVADPPQAGYLTLFQCGERPFVAHVNYTAGETESNMAAVPITPEGDVCIFTSTPADVVLDVLAWSEQPYYFRLP